MLKTLKLYQSLIEVTQDTRIIFKCPYCSYLVDMIEVNESQLTRYGKDKIDEILGKYESCPSCHKELLKTDYDSIVNERSNQDEMLNKR